jgi:hypothetical protein
MPNETGVVTESIGKEYTAYETERYNALVLARSTLTDSASNDKLGVANYASAINGIFGMNWYENEACRKGVKAERELFKRSMAEKGHDEKIERVYWQRVKVAAGYQTNGMKVKGSETLDQKTMKELKTIINRIIAVEDSNEGIDESGQLSAENKKALMNVYTAMGGDVMTLGAKV